jgi:hypothetical protein
MISGRVIGPQGEPVPDLVVRLQCTESGAEGVSYDIRTRSDGSYVFDCGYPATGRVLVFPSEDSLYFDLPRPSSDPFEVLPHEQVVIPDLVFQFGECLIVGSVVDQFGAPVPETEVICYEWPGTWANAILVQRTQDDGAFTLSGLPRKRVAVQALEGRAGDRQVKEASDVLVFELAEAPGVQHVAPIQVKVDILRTISGMIVINGVAVPATDLKLEATWFDDHQSHAERIRIEDGSLSWGYSTASTGITLQLTYAPQDQERVQPALVGRVVELSLDDNDTQGLVLVFP